jgi:putative sterol carrier protein
MVAVAETDSTSGPVETLVTLAAGEEASGLARITGQYLEQMLADSPEKREEASRLRGRLGLHAREGDVEITLAFGEGPIVIEEGLREPDAVISGSLETLLDMLGGRRNPALALGRGDISVRISASSPAFGYRAYHLMRLPGVHVWNGVPPQAAAVVGVGAAVLLLLWLRRRARQ